MPRLPDYQSVVTADQDRVSRYLPLDAKNNRLIVLDQVRKTKPSRADRERMRQSFVHEGQITAGVVVALSKKEAIKYLEQIGSLWRKSYNIADYRRARWNSVTYYFFVVAGHMRLDTAQCLCDEHFAGGLKDLGQFRLGYYAELRFGLTAEQAVQIQITENVNHPVDPVDEKFAAQMVYQWKQGLNEKFTKKDLANMFHRSVAWVESAILLAELPEAIQRLGIEPGDYGGNRVVAPQYILEGVARLARFRAQADFPMTQSEMSDEVFVCVAKGLSSSEHARRVSDQITHLRGDGSQTTMDLQGGFSGTRNPSQVRKVAGDGIASTMAGLKQSLRLLMQMLQDGLLGYDVNPISPEVDPEILEQYSFGSPSDNLGDLSVLFQEILPLLARYVELDSGASLAKALINAESVEASSIVLSAFGRLETEARALVGSNANATAAE